MPPTTPPPASQPTTTSATEPTKPPAVPPPAPAPSPKVAPPASQPAPAISATAALPIPDPVAYWAGLTAGRRIRARLMEDGRGFDDTVVLKGVIDGLTDRDPAYPRAAVQAAVDQLQANVLERRAEKRAADDPAFRRLAEDNGQHTRDLLAENAKLPDVKIRPDGVQVRILHDGTGRPVAAARSATLKLTVSLLDGTLIAAGDPARPSKVELADALPALVETLRTMRVGDRWQIVVPPEKGYGLAGDPPMIGPNQAVAYDVELVDAE
jgi:FKBP-type peptidyl-prolyl cis-trans isomerase